MLKVLEDWNHPSFLKISNSNLYNRQKHFCCLAHKVDQHLIYSFNYNPTNFSQINNYFINTITVNLITIWDKIYRWQENLTYDVFYLIFIIYCLYIKLFERIEYISLKIINSDFKFFFYKNLLFNSLSN